jgi:hypothetical protein
MLLACRARRGRWHGTRCRRQRHRPGHAVCGSSCKWRAPARSRAQAWLCRHDSECTRAHPQRKSRAVDGSQCTSRGRLDVGPAAAHGTKNRNSRRRRPAHALDDSRDIRLSCRAERALAPALRGSSYMRQGQSPAIRGRGGIGRSRRQRAARSRRIFRGAESGNRCTWAPADWAQKRGMSDRSSRRFRRRPDEPSPILWHGSFDNPRSRGSRTLGSRKRDTRRTRCSRGPRALGAWDLCGTRPTPTGPGGARRRESLAATSEQRPLCPPRERSPGQRTPTSADARAESRPGPMTQTAG